MQTLTEFLALHSLRRFVEAHDLAEQEAAWLAQRGALQAFAEALDQPIPPPGPSRGVGAKK